MEKRQTRHFPALEVDLGNHRSADAYLENARRKGHVVAQCCKGMMGWLQWPQFLSTERLVRVHDDEDLNLRKNYTFDELKAAATELGLRLCSPSTAPELRDQYEDGQPLDEALTVAAEPVLDDHYCLPFLFVVWRDAEGKCILGATEAYSGRTFKPGITWVFAQSVKAEATTGGKSFV